ncbi:MAG: GerW family sporulation protein, partial [Candidatus Latescibacterota bacterium]|nr:GerW family sporulation protein [Candidatus Latescibacterota bacterium]
GSKDDGGGGTAGGGSVEPVGFIVIHKGKAQMIPINEYEMSIGKLLSYAPDVIKKIKDFKDKKKDGEEDTESKEDGSSDE